MSSGMVLLELHLLRRQRGIAKDQVGGLLGEHQ
jgi:hypothetical protein